MVGERQPGLPFLAWAVRVSHQSHWVRRRMASFWLARMGAQITGYSLNPPTEPSFYECARPKTLVPGTFGDVRDRNSMKSEPATACASSTCRGGPTPRCSAAHPCGQM